MKKILKLYDVTNQKYLNLPFELNLKTSNNIDSNEYDIVYGEKKIPIDKNIYFEFPQLQLIKKEKIFIKKERILKLTDDGIEKLEEKKKSIENMIDWSAQKKDNENYNGYVNVENKNLSDNNNEKITKEYKQLTRDIRKIKQDIAKLNENMDKKEKENEELTKKINENKKNIFDFETKKNEYNTLISSIQGLNRISKANKNELIKELDKGKISKNTPKENIQEKQKEIKAKIDSYFNNLEEEVLKKLNKKGEDFLNSYQKKWNDLEDKRKQEYEKITKENNDAITHLKELVDSNNIKHYNKTCKKCNKSPIEGILYKCSECNDDYYLCEKCELKNYIDKEHPHDFIKIRKEKINNIKFKI